MKIQDFESHIVRHILLGLGIIEKAYYEPNSNNYRIKVLFNSGHQSVFIFPDCFEKLIRLDDEKAQQYVEQLIKEKYEKLKQEKLEKERLRLEEEQRKKEEYEYYIKNKRKLEYIKQQHLYFKTKHEKEFPYSTFLVYQGKSWKYELKDQILCIWREYNRKVAFWDIIQELKPLDILLHCQGQSLVAISRVSKEAYESDTDSRGDNIKSLKVDYDANLLDNPVDLRLFREDIKNYDEENEPKLSPFNKYGLGNQGYIYPIDRDLAQAFVVEAVKNNQGLLEVSYIKELLELYT